VQFGKAELPGSLPTANSTPKRTVFSYFSLFIFHLSCYIYPDRRLEMPVAELLIEEIKTLPANRIAEILDFVEFIKQKEARNAVDECPICAAHRDPETGNPLYKPEVYADMQEADDMLSGKIPSTLKQFNSLEEMLADLDSDD
jgi:hypothetical protein